MLCYIMLCAFCYVMIWYVSLRYVMVRYIMLCYVCYIMLQPKKVNQFGEQKLVVKKKKYLKHQKYRTK